MAPWLERTFFVLDVVSTKVEGDIQAGSILQHPGTLLLVLGVALLIQFRDRFLCPPLRSDRVEVGNSAGGDQSGRHGIQFSFAPPGSIVPELKASEADVKWFEEMVIQTYEVSRGIFCGERGGASLPAWSNGAFLAALREMRREVAQVKWPDAGVLHEPLDDVVMTSRLIATNLDIPASISLVNEYAEYRRTTQGGVPPSIDWVNSGTSFVPGEDRLGRPAIFIRPRYHKPGNLDVFRAGLRTTLDAVKAHMLQRRKAGTFSRSNPLEQYAMVFDFEGASWRNIDWDAFHCTISEGTLHYPNMGSQIYVINVNSAVQWVWSSASRLLHPKIRRKCCLISPDGVVDCMKSLFPIETLPPKYGGTGKPWPPPSEAITFGDQVGDLVAKVYVRAGCVPKGAKPENDAGGSPASTDVVDEAPGTPARTKQGALAGCCLCFPWID